MLSIFAIDPQICENLDWFRYCTEHCQPSQGRVIADLPDGQWYQNAEAIIDQYAQDHNLPDIKKRSLISRLQKVGRQLVKRPGNEWTNWYYDYSLDSYDFSQFSWITEIEKEHQRERFSAVVSPEYEGADDEIKEYHPDELNRNVEAWNTPSGVAITRSPGEFVDAILPMLRLASNIHFVDGYFNVDDNSLFTENYKQIIEDLAKHRNTPDYPFPSLTIHCYPKPDEMTEKGKGNIEKGLKKHYAPLIPKGESVTVFAWQINEKKEDRDETGKDPRGDNPFHNRYVLTNHCGVIVGYGTDSANQNTDAPDILQIIDSKIHKKLWNQIQDEEYPIIRIRDDSDRLIHIEEGNKFVINSTKSA